METNAHIRSHLAALSAHLRGRLDAVLDAWMEDTAADPAISTAAALTRTEFRDHIPAVLDAFARALANGPADGGQSVTVGAIEEEAREFGAKHGMQRWQRSFHLRELIGEWGHLHFCFLEELDAYFAVHRDVPPEVASAARAELVRLVHGGLTESADQYSRLARDEAAGHARDLQRAVANASELERIRGELLRQSVHDLGGSMQNVHLSAEELADPTLPETDRNELTGILLRGVDSLRSMLSELMNLARLEAGQEKRQVNSFDAAGVTTAICEGARPLAIHRGLELQMEGPPSLRVVGDAGKMARILQNLLNNALKYTEHGGVTVRWGERDATHWKLEIQDTGPGLSRGPGAPIMRDLQEATSGAHEAEARAGDTVAAEKIALPPERLPARQKAGEGIGLSIVKRLCELLDAGLELESPPEGGTLFRVSFPSSYPAEDVGNPPASR